jgi:hypothetical protein
MSTISMDFDVVSVDSVSKGKSSFKRTCKSNRCPTTQTLSDVVEAASARVSRLDPNG